MTPEDLCDKLLGGKRIAIMHDEFRQVMLDTIRAAYAVENEACARLMDEMWADASAGEAIRARLVAYLEEQP